jgi:hypothetical protein
VVTVPQPSARWSPDGTLAALVATAPEQGVPEPSDEQTEAYDAGRAAYDAGESSTSCPHDPRSELGTLWVRGYVLARRDDQYGPIR